ncbi:MAG: hypothetical protein RLO12_17325 [Fulvivirga sp.]
MKIIKSIGLLLFIAGFSIFISTFFTANYKLSEDALSAQLGDAAKIESFKEHADFIGESITSNFAFVAKLDEVFNSVNQEKLSQFGISETEIDKLVNSNQGKFDINTISLFGDDETGQYKQKTFKDYGGWLDGREFGSQEEMRSQISNVVENIKKYQIVNEKG